MYFLFYGINIHGWNIKYADTFKSQAPQRNGENPGENSYFFTAFQEEPSEPESELCKYLNQKGAQHTDPLKWWEENEAKFPSLAGLAKKYLAIPGTSVPSERIFSTAGTVVNKLRSRLSSTVVDQIVFLNKNDKHSCAESCEGDE